VRERTRALVPQGYQSVGRPEEALPLLEESLRRGRATLAAADPHLANLLETLASAYAATNRWAEAGALWTELLKKQRQTLHADSSSVVRTLQSLGECLLRQGKPAEAESLLEENAAIRARRAPEHWTTFRAKGLLGAALLGQKRFAEAEPLRTQAHEGIQERRDNIPEKDRQGRLTESVEALVRLYTEWGKPELARQWRTRLTLEQPAPLPESAATPP
jgi:tetratricopeptide (TPR) repeat protein